jgi:hypothetical protein
LKRLLVTIFCAFSSLTYGQTNSVLVTGTWVKMSVPSDGVYKIDYALFRKLGINPDQTDPRKIRIFAGNYGMLPQANSAQRISDLKEIAIQAIGQEDGVFNASDYLLFFGQGPDHYQLDFNKGVFQYENNLYADKSYYFITIGPSNGLRMADVPSLPGSYPVINEFDDFSYYETEQYNELHSGRNWYGEQFSSKSSYTIRFTVPGIVDGSDLKLVYRVMAQSVNPSTFQFSLNSQLLQEKAMPTIINASYTDKGTEAADTLIISSATGQASSTTNWDVTIRYNKAATEKSIAYLDRLLFQYKRVLALYGDQTAFSSLASAKYSAVKYSMKQLPASARLWDITDPFNPAVQATALEGANTVFQAVTGPEKKYLILSSAFPAPAAEGKVSNQNLHGITKTNLVIVSAPEFVSEAQRLANFRQSKNGITTSVVSTTQVYNEFSGGKQDVTAIRDFARWLYANNTGIKNLLLIGRGSYDYKNYLSYNKNFVPTYESRNSLSPLESYASDDYYGFLEPNEGNWGENPVENHTLDIGVGRLPVKKLEEAQQIVNKLLEYGQQPGDDWRKQILFVADDGDDNIHQQNADELAELIASQHPDFTTDKLYVDNFKQVNVSFGQLAPASTEALNRAAVSGYAIINYTGHGNEQQWMAERILDQFSILTWKNAPRYPLLLTATCEFGRNDDPGIISTAEQTLLMGNGGSIGLVTTTRLVNSATNFFLNKAFYQALFIKVGGQYRDLGTVMRDTKNNSVSGISNRNFSLLGDPSMILVLPPSDIQVTGLQNLTSGSDTLKALSTVRVSGRIISNGTADTDYTGTAIISLFDKPFTEITKGDENPPFTFINHRNPVFRGLADVRQGRFTLEFTLPAFLNPVVGTGMLSLYATSEVPGNDRTGASVIQKIGSMEKNPGPDTQGPSISLFMGDTTFIPGGTIGSNSRIVAILSDAHGIATSRFNPQQSIVGLMDDTISWVLNNYYLAKKNNPAMGIIDFPVFGLKNGNHRLTLSASDVYGNRSTAVLVFTVSDQGSIQVNDWLAYPNPMTNEAVFHFTHSRSSEDLEAVVTVFDRVGQTLFTATYSVPQSDYQVNLPAWDGSSSAGIKLSPGLYLIKLSVRSLVDGSKNEKITKVIISN